MQCKYADLLPLQLDKKAEKQADKCSAFLPTDGLREHWI